MQPRQPTTPPTAEGARALLDQVDRLVLAQTNVFIRELLRDLGKRPGDSKARFRAALEEAIADGSLTKEGLDAWLHGVEGWGNQHIYPFDLPPALAVRDLWTEDRVAALVEAAFRKKWRAPISYDYASAPELARIDLYGDGPTFVAEWHQKSSSWVREEARDRKDVWEDGDLYWYRAFRSEPGRILTRFAVHWPGPNRAPVAALLLRLPVRTPEHAAATATVWAHLDNLSLAGVRLSDAQHRPWSISALIKNVDDSSVRSEGGFRSKRTRFSEGLASVEFMSSPELLLPDRIREVRLSITEKTLAAPDFVGSSGEFMAAGDAARPTSREARVQLFHDDNRLRVWTELDEADVWTLLGALDALRR